MNFFDEKTVFIYTTLDRVKKTKVLNYVELRNFKVFLNVAFILNGVMVELDLEYK